MASLKISVGETIPKGTFGTIPYTEELADHVSSKEANLVLTNHLRNHVQSACGIRTSCSMHVPVKSRLIKMMTSYHPLY